MKSINVFHLSWLRMLVIGGLLFGLSTAVIAEKNSTKEKEFQMVLKDKKWEGAGLFDGKKYKVTISGPKTEKEKLEFPKNGYLMFALPDNKIVFYGQFKPETIINGKFYQVIIDQNTLKLKKLKKIMGTLNLKVNAPNVISNLSTTCYLQKLLDNSFLQGVAHNNIPVGKYKIATIQAVILAKDKKSWRLSYSSPNAKITITSNKAATISYDLPIIKVAARDLKKRLAKAQEMQTKYKLGATIEFKLAFACKDKATNSSLALIGNGANPQLKILDAKGKEVAKKTLTPG